MDLLLNKRTKISVEAVLRNFSGAIGLFGEQGSGRFTVATHIIGELADKPADSLDKWPYFRRLSGKETGIESIRDLQKFLHLSVPGDARIKRAVVLEDFDQTSAEAQNALLKTIEEPPVDTVIILTASSEISILTTVLSRITSIPVLPISKSEIIDRFASEVSVVEIDRYYNLSSGRIGTFMGLISADTDNHEVNVIEYAKQLLSLSRGERLARIDAITKSKDHTPLEVIDGLVKIHRAILVSRLKQAKDKGELTAMYRNLEASYEALSDVSNGVHAKLALSRLFIS